MVLPRDRAKQKKQAEIVKSRKARKKLEKIVLRKKSKVDRSKLLADLKKCQLQPDQMDALHSTSSMQTKGLKRFLNDDGGLPERLKDIDRAEKCLDAAILLGRKKRKVKRKTSNESASSSSEDTDAVSTDTEAYYESANEPCDEEEFDNKLVKSAEDYGTTSGDTNFKDEAQPHLHCDIKESKLTESPEFHDAVSITPQPRLPAIFVQVNRLPEVEKSRLELPIIGEEQSIMEKIRYQDIVIVSGETGSGKTTQLPQFLYEAGYTLNGKLVGITEPRRVAAVSMSERVAHELNLSNKEVSYQIRFSGNVSDKTQIKFMTDGVLLRECQQDFLLSKYSALIIDEAHERSVFSDILIGLLSRIVPMRAKRGNPLKLIIMSATMRVKDFTDNKFLFTKIPPVIKIDARQFPVTVNFARRTPSNYLQAAFRKVCSIHSRMPKGGILVFVTSQMDVKVLCKKLREKFPSKQTPTSNQHKTTKKRSKLTKKKADENENVRTTLENIKENIHFESDEEEAVEADERGHSRIHSNFFEFSDVDSDLESDEEGAINITSTPLHCLGLFAMLPMEKQQLVFKDPPEGSRLCVIATNVAETSITIPNIKYVVDSGKEKTKIYDLVTGVSKFETVWTSKSSAEQRMGRAGRMGPGHCYRLYSSAVFTNDFADYAQPRILQKPVEDVLLQMKSMNIDNVINFPFPTRPPVEALMAAEKKLVLLDALDDSKSKKARPQDRSKIEFTSRPTPLGKAMACFAVSARCSKMIVLSPPDLLPFVVALVSALTVREMFLEGVKWNDLKKKWSGHGTSRKLGDFMVMLKAIITADSFECSNKQCLENGLRTKAMLEIDKLRRQLTNEINNNLSYPTISKEFKLKKPSDNQINILRQLLLSSFCDHVARKLPDGEVVKPDPNDPNKIEKKRLKNAYECMEVEGPVYIGPESVLKRDHPEFIIYKELYQGDKKMFMRDVTVIEPEWLPYYAHKLCRFNEPSAKTPSNTKYDCPADQIICNREATYGPLNWSLGTVEVPMQFVDSGVEIYKHFASFLLSGQVIPWFKKYASKLLSPPNILTKPWSKLLPRCNKLLQALIGSGIKSRKDLFKVWKIDQNCKYYQTSNHKTTPSMMLITNIVLAFPSIYLQS